MAWIFSALLQGHKNEPFVLPWILHARTVLTFLFLFLSICGHSQKLIWSEATRNDRAVQRVQAIAQADTLFHVIEERDDHILRWLRYGRESLKMIGAQEIIPLSDENTLEYFFIRRDTLHTLSTRWNREENMTEVLLVRYDETGNVIGDALTIHKRNESSQPRNSGLQCIQSPDSAHVLIYFDKENERQQTEGIHFRCFDMQWSVIWEKELRLPPSPDILQVHHFLVDNFGGVYLMSGRKPVKTTSDWQRPQGGQYVVYYYNPERNKLKQYDISLKDKQVISVDFLLNEQQGVVIAGYYSENFQNQAAGTLMFAIQAQGGSISLAGYTPFSKEFIKEMSGREKGTLDEFYLDHLYLTEDGSVILAGEQYYVSRSVSTDPTTGRQLVEYRYNYDDIMLCMMDSTAQHVWNTRIPKRQMTSILNDPNFSYAFAADAEGIAITFNDDSANNEIEEDRKRNETSLWSGTKNSVTTRVAIAFNGVQTRRTLMDNNTERLLFNPLMTVSEPLSRTLLGFDDRRTYKFCRLQ